MQISGHVCMCVWEGTPRVGMPVIVSTNVLHKQLTDVCNGDGRLLHSIQVLVVETLPKGQQHSQNFFAHLVGLSQLTVPYATLNASGTPLCQD